MKHFFIIRGPVGVGKSTIAKEFAKQHSFAYLGSDVFVWAFFPMRTQTLTEYELVFENMYSVLENFFKKSYSVVLEGALTPWIKDDPLTIDAFVTLAKEHGYVVHKIKLMADREVCAQRMEQRGMVCRPETVEKVRDFLLKDTESLVLDGTLTPNELLTQLSDMLN